MAADELVRLISQASMWKDSDRDAPRIAKALRANPDVVLRALGAKLHVYNVDGQSFYAYAMPDGTMPVDHGPWSEVKAL